MSEATLLPSVERGLAWHVDGCPIPARVWKGNACANAIDDCIGCEHMLTAGDIGVMCDGFRALRRPRPAEEAAPRPPPEAFGHPEEDDPMRALGGWLDAQMSGSESHDSTDADGANSTAPEDDDGGAAMHTPASDGETEARARTPEPSGGEDTRYYYYIDRRPVPSVVFVCDHAYDCESIYPEASEEEVLALIGAPTLHAAQDECARNGLGSQRLLLYLHVSPEPPAQQLWKSIAELLPALFECSPAPQGGIRVRTPLLYPDGGVVDVFVLKDKRQRRVSDLGEALGWLCARSGSEGRSAEQAGMIEDMCQTHGVALHRGQFVRRLRAHDDLAEAVLRVAQAAARVSDLWFTLRPGRPTRE